jgi:hypothetical protein
VTTRYNCLLSFDICAAGWFISESPVGLFLTSAAGLLRADATGWIGSDGTKSWQEDGGKKPEEGKFKNRLGEEYGPKKTACSNRQDQDISITPLGDALFDPLDQNISFSARPV